MKAPAQDITIDEALNSALLGATLGDLGTWVVWRTVLKAAFGLGLSCAEVARFTQVAGGRKPPGRRVRELWAAIGRRSGKSRIAALVAVYLAALAPRPKLAAGEVGTVLVLAASKLQAQTVFNYCKAFLEAPVLARLVEETTADEIRLRGGVTIAVHSNSYKTVRGRTLLAAIFDEVRFWRDELSSQPDVETYRAVLPALATTNGMLIAISSPYAQRGLLYTKHQSAFGKDDADTLVIQAPTTAFNPTIDAALIERAREDDPEAARAEWDAQFRGDLSTFVDRAILEQCVEPGVDERPFQIRFKYLAHVDPSGGQHDSFALAISHREGERVVLDLVQEWKAPFSPPDVVEDAVAVLKRYRLNAICGDAYAAAWVRDAFRLHGVTYKQSEKNRSEIYLDFLPQLTSGSAVLLDHPRLINQLAMLERRTGRTGKDAVDHMRGGFDDLAVAAAGACVNANSLRGTYEEFRKRNYDRPDRANLGYANVKRIHASWGGPSR